jgi:glutathione S-transferase
MILGYSGGADSGECAATACGAWTTRIGTAWGEARTQMGTALRMADQAMAAETWVNGETFAMAD